MIYTSIETQVLNMVEAWNWVQTDRTLLVLPLHHIHGIVNILTTCLWVGASCQMMAFDSVKVWQQLLCGSVNTFMAVPTIYSKLIETFDTFPKLEQEIATKKLSNFKLMVSGSMALPEPLFKRWQEVSGHRLLERYGMTETGMVLTNPFSPVEGRIEGTVGKAFSRVMVNIQPADPAVPNIGELLVKGPQLFREYFNKPQATIDAFTPDGWFKTGDIVEKFEDGTYKILGRNSVDILKSGGYKISALEVEREYLGHSNVKDVAVIGLEDDVWGQRVHCFIVLKSSLDSPSEQGLFREELRDFGKKRLAPYKVPRSFQFIDDLPKNVMGKVQKKDLVAIANPVEKDKSS